MTEYLCVGWISRPHGLKGDVFIRLFSKSTDWLESPGKIGVKVFKAKSGAISDSVDRELHLLSYRARPDGIYACLKESTDRDYAEALVSLAVFVETSHLVASDEEAPFLLEYVGANVVSTVGVALGRVTGLASNGAQDILVIQDGEDVYELPLVFPLVRDFDRERKVVTAEIPEGLRDLNRR